MRGSVRRRSGALTGQPAPTLHTFFPLLRHPRDDTHSLNTLNPIILILGSDHTFPLQLAKKSVSSNSASILHLHPNSSPTCLQSFSNDLMLCLKDAPSRINRNSPASRLPSGLTPFTVFSCRANCFPDLTYPSQSNKWRKGFI